MGYFDKKEIYEESIRLIKERDFYFIEDIVPFLPCSKATFYEYFPAGSDELDNIKVELNKKKIATKEKIRRKWAENDNATTQIALYKLTCTTEERKRLATNYNENNESHAGSMKVEIVTEDIPALSTNENEIED